jgi:hypothetical protein
LRHEPVTFVGFQLRKNLTEQRGFSGRWYEKSRSALFVCEVKRRERSASGLLFNQTGTRALSRTEVTPEGNAVNQVGTLILATFFSVLFLGTGTNQAEMETPVEAGDHLLRSFVEDYKFSIAVP